MIPALDIWRSAQVLMKHHGQDAPIEAAMRADAMLEKDDLHGYAVWKRVAKIAAELLSKGRPRRTPVQSRDGFSRGFRRGRGVRLSSNWSVRF